MPITICPAITPRYDRDFRNVINYVVANGKGANAVFILGSTGEFSSIPLSRKKELISIAADEIRAQNSRKANVQLAVGVSGGGLKESVELARYAEQAGADYAVFMPLWVVHPESSPKRVEDCVTYLLDETQKIPFMVYNYPDKTGGRNIDVSTWRDLSVQQERIVALKDSSGSLEILRGYRAAAQNDSKVFVGSEEIGLRSPGDGVVHGSMNILPVPWNFAIKRGNEDELAAYASKRLADFIGVYKSNPIGAFHYVLSTAGKISTKMPNNPANEVSPELGASLDKLMEDADFTQMFKSCE